MSVCVFDNPEHSNGGCIFADPSQPLVDIAPEVGGGGKRKRRYERPDNYTIALREDEEIIAALQVFLSRRRH